MFAIRFSISHSATIKLRKMPDFIEIYVLASISSVVCENDARTVAQVLTGFGTTRIYRPNKLLLVLPLHTPTDIKAKRQNKRKTHDLVLYFSTLVSNIRTCIFNSFLSITPPFDDRFASFANTTNNSKTEKSIKKRKYRN